MVDQALNIIEHARGGVNSTDLRLKFKPLIRVDHRLQCCQGLTRIGALKQSALGVGIRIAERHLHQKPVKLGFRQGIGSGLMQRILGGNHKKRFRQREGFAIDADLMFFHGFEQRALRFRRTAIDFVGQQHVREHGSGMQAELPGIGMIDTRA